MKREFTKGLIFGIGVLIPCLVVVALVYGIVSAASIQHAMENKNSEIVIDYASPTKFIYLDETVTQHPNIDTVRTGVITGIQKASYDNGKTLIDVPIIKPGYVITFKTPPLQSDLDKLDLEMSMKGMKREGGKTIVDAVTKIQTVTGIK